MQDKIAQQFFEWWEKQFENLGMPERVVLRSEQLMKFNIGLARADKSSRIAYFKWAGMEYLFEVAGDAGKDEARFSLMSLDIPEALTDSTKNLVLGGLDGEYFNYFHTPIFGFSRKIFEGSEYHAFLVEAVSTNEVYHRTRESIGEIFSCCRKNLLAPLHLSGIQHKKDSAT